MRTIVIGDIHGCYAEMLQLLAKVEISDADCLISLGDIVDRGADSVQVYDFLKNRPNTIVLMGNPAIYWLSIPATLLILYTWLKNRTNYVAASILIAIFAQYLPFALIKRLSFLYYFYPTTPFIILAITYTLKLVFTSKNKSHIYVAYAYIGLVILLFVLFFPVLSGIEIPRTYTVNTLWFLKSWNF